MMCSLYASVQGIDDSPFLPHGVLHGLWLLFTVIDSSNKLLNFKIYLFWIIPICEMFSIFNKTPLYNFLKNKITHKALSNV